jgi:hypothetical protein
MRLTAQSSAAIKICRQKADLKARGGSLATLKRIISRKMPLFSEERLIFADVCAKMKKNTRCPVTVSSFRGEKEAKNVKIRPQA